MQEKQPKKKIEITKVITLLFILIIILYYSGALDSFKTYSPTPEESAISTTIEKSPSKSTTD